MSVIVIEDDDFNYDVIETVLSGSGFTDVKQIKSGEEAIHYIENVRENTTWIVDGMFPMNGNWPVEELWPKIVDSIRRFRWQTEVIIGFSTISKIFKALESESWVNHNFNKDTMSVSLPQIVEVLSHLRKNSQDGLSETVSD